MNLPADFVEYLAQLRDIAVSLRNEGESQGTSSNLGDYADRLDDLTRQLAWKLQHNSSDVELNLLSEIGLMLARAVDIQQVLEAIVDRLHEVIPYSAAGIFVTSRDSDKLRGQVLRGYDPSSFERVQQKVDEGLLGWVISKGETLNIRDVRKDSRYIQAREATRSELVVPIVFGDEVLGAINVEDDKIDSFTETHITLVKDLASHAAIAIDRAHTHDQIIAASKLARELSIARTIQTNLLPTVKPEIDGFDIAGLNIPSHAVGGDYFDFIPLGDDNFGIIIADVAGKGVPAGLVMAGLRAALRTRVETTYSIREILEMVNRFLLDSTGAEAFVTAFYGVLNLSNDVFTYSNAGHNPPLLFRQGGEMIELEEGGPLLGVLPEPEFNVGMVELKSGDALVLHTDGIVEAGGDCGEEFGEDRFFEVLRTNLNAQASELIDAIIDATERWYDRQSEPDDRTLIVVKKL